MSDASFLVKLVEQMIANLLTASRLFLIPIIIHLILTGQSTAALLVFAFAALTDLLDGAVARRLNEVTELGRILDPLTDRLLISSMVIALFLRNGIGPPLWAILVLVGRDILILVGSTWLTWKGRPVEVTMLGKTATAVLLLAILLMVAELEIGLWLFYAGLIFYVVSGFNYFMRGKKYGNPASKSYKKVEIS